MKTPAQRRPRAVLFGTGGHARVLVEIILEARDLDLIGALTADAEWWGKTFYTVPVRGDDAQLPQLIAQGATRFVVGVGSAGSTQARRAVFEKAVALGLTPQTIRHISAVAAASAVLGPGCQLLARSVVNSNARLGANVIVNTGAIIEHDCQVGESAHVATGAVLCGQVSVGPGAHIGANATVRQGVRIGANAIVGAGAVVLRDVADGDTVAGVPARSLVASPRTRPRPQASPARAARRPRTPQRPHPP